MEISHVRAVMLSERVSTRADLLSLLLVALGSTREFRDSLSVRP